MQRGACRDMLEHGTQLLQRSGIEGRSALRTSPSDCTDGPPPFAVLEADADAVTHIDFTHPFDPGLRGRLLAAAAGAGIAVRDGGTYAATQGPRLESAAEIRRLERDGADLVGMTGMPEAALAREAGLAYAMLAVVANDAAGKGDSATAVALDAAQAAFDAGMARARKVLLALLRTDMEAA